jgi:hypothetical protein
MYYIAVVGSREFWNKTLLFDAISHVIKENKDKPITLVSGGARGADSLAALYAKEHSINIIEYLPDWSIGKHAGFIRNRQIIEKADYVIAALVQTLPCRGTWNSISIAQELKKPINYVHSIPKPPVIRIPHIRKVL